MVHTATCWRQTTSRIGCRCCGAAGLWRSRTCAAAGSSGAGAQRRQCTQHLLARAAACFSARRCLAAVHAVPPFRWHAAGRQLAKPNSVADLLACLRLLFERGVTRPGLVAGHAASAGCLTLAAALNARPAWFAAAVLEAPFVDWAGCMGDGGGADVLREHELDEWGDPSADARVAAMIAALCPYSNLAHGSSGGTGGAAATLPPMLVTAGLRDARVPLAMPAKFVAKLRAVAQAGAAGRQPPPLVLLQFDEAAGHFSQGVSGGVLEDVGVQQAFLLLAIEAAAGAAAEGRAA